MGRTSQAVARTSASRRVVAGTLLLALATVLSVPGIAGTAQAQEAPEGDDEAVEDDGGLPGATTEAFEVTDLTLYASSLADVVPETLRTGIPPAVVCVLASELCPEQLDPIRNAASELFNRLLDSVPAEPFHPVPPDTAAVSVLAGVDRYQSALRFELPDIPADEEFTTFEVRFGTTFPSYDVNSPAFRRIVLGLFSSLGQDNDPGPFFEGLQEGLTDTTPIEINEDILGIEACPFTTAFEPGGPPAAQSAEEDLPRDEEFDEVEVDCLLGSSGLLDEETGEWVFDLTFAATAWQEGELDNLGILLRPTGVNNLAFGDPDITTSGQINLDADEVEITFASAEPPPPIEGFDDDLGGFDDGLSDDGFADDGFDDGFEDGFALDDGFDDAGSLDSGQALGGPTAVDGPSVADGATAEQPVASDAQQQPQVIAQPARGEPIDPWWLWLLVPLFGAGGYLVAAPLLAPTTAGGATAAPGAMTRLLARSGSGLA